jgi:hypothetical protein
MKGIYVSSITLVMMLGWFAVPDFVSADWSTYSQRYWTERHPADRGLLGRDSLIHHVDFSAFHDHFGLTLGRDKEKRESERDRGSDSALSGKGMRSYNTPLGPSFDMPDSVNGHSRTPDPWWGRRTEGEPMLKDLNRNPMKSR